MEVGLDGHTLRAAEEPRTFSNSPLTCASYSAGDQSDEVEKHTRTEDSRRGVVDSGRSGLPYDWPKRSTVLGSEGAEINKYAASTASRLISA